MSELLQIFVWIYFGLLRLIARRRPVNYVFDCPHCKEVRMGKYLERITYDGDLRPTSGIRTFKCSICLLTFDAESFLPDSSGVFHLKTWDCPNCQHINPNTTFSCQSCGFSLT